MKTLELTLLLKLVSLTVFVVIQQRFSKNHLIIHDGDDVYISKTDA